MKLPKTVFGIDTEEAYQRVLSSQETKPKPKNQKEQKETNLETLEDFWTIGNVEYRNGIYTVDLAKELLDNGNTKTQEQWAEYSKQAKQNNSFHTGDFPLYHAIFTTLFNNRNGKQKNDVEEIRQFIKQKMVEKWIMTLTRIQYNPKKQKDKVIHNYNLPDQYPIETDSFVGDDGYIKSTNNVKAPLQTLLDTKQNVNEINDVYKWLTDVDAYLWRVNSEVKNTDERVARFVAFSVRAYLDCDGDPQDSGSGLGVRLRA